MQTTNPQNESTELEKTQSSGFVTFLKNPIVKTILIVVVIGVVLLLIYKSGRDTIIANQKKIPLVKVENDGSIDENFKSSAVEYVKEISRVTDGVDWWNVGLGGIKSKHFEAKNQIYGTMLKMTRPQLFYTYNLYNLTYYPKTEETMVQSVVGDQSSIIQNSPENESKIISKMQTLKLP